MERDQIVKELEEFYVHRKVNMNTVFYYYKEHQGYLNTPAEFSLYIQNYGVEKAVNAMFTDLRDKHNIMIVTDKNDKFIKAG
jgi:hypothetical protein